jgi:hypothetical protein
MECNRTTWENGSPEFLLESIMKEQIKGIGYDGKVWLLIDEVTQISVKVGDIRESFRGERAKMIDGTAPHKPSSTGRVQSSKGEYYPGVYGCKWIKV